MKTVYNCQRIWRKDWSESIIIEATVTQVRKFAHQIRKIVGKDFMFELSLQVDKPEYFIDDKNGLISYFDHN